MGKAPFGTVEVQWLGGIRNRLYRVFPGEPLVLPEIPCSFDLGGRKIKGLFRSYTRGLSDALGELKHAGTIFRQHAHRLYISALIAFWNERRR